MNAKDCQVLLNGQPVQNFILFCGEPTVTMNMQNINYFAAVGILRSITKSLEDYLASQNRIEAQPQSQPQQARITIDGVTLDATALQKMQQQGARDEVIEKMQTKIEELERILKAKEGIASGYV